MSDYFHLYKKYKSKYSNLKKLGGANSMDYKVGDLCWSINKNELMNNPYIISSIVGDQVKVNILDENGYKKERPDYSLIELTFNKRSYHNDHSILRDNTHSKWGLLKNLKTNYTKINLSIPILPYNEINSRVNSCIEKGGSLTHIPHFTLYSGIIDSSNLQVINTLSTRLEILRIKFLELCTKLNNNGIGSGNYVILGKEVPIDLKNHVFTYKEYEEKKIDGLKEIASRIITNIREEMNRGVFLARLFFNDNDNENADFSEIYELIKDGEVSIDDDINYKKENFQQFKLHLSIAKFKNIDDAINGLCEIYKKRYSPITFEIFKKHLSRHISLTSTALLKKKLKLFI